MNKRLCKTMPMLCVALAVVLLGAVAVAQDVFQVNYYTNAQVVGAPSANVYIDNPGEANHKHLCAMIYVFSADQEMDECCGCNESPDNLSTLSVNTDLTSNPLTGRLNHRGVIKIVSAALDPLGGCDPTGSISPVVPTPDLRAWATHIQDRIPFGTFSGFYNPVTEDEFLDASLSSAELAALQAQCYFINVLGTGHGICTCGNQQT
jgi:hypothetical protein